MITLAEMIRRLDSVNLREELPVLVNESKYEILRLNKENQLKYGFSSRGVGNTRNGQKINPKYKRDDYAKKKFAQNSLAGYGTPDLFLSGEFYREMDIIVDDFTYSIFSGVDYSANLINKYGEDIFGLSAANKAIYSRETLFPLIKNYIQDKTGLVFR